MTRVSKKCLRAASAWFLVELSPGSSSMKRPESPGEDPGELEAFILAPVEEALHHTGIGSAGVRIGDAGGEELIGGKEGLGAGTLEHGRDRSGRIEGLGSGHKGGLSRRSVRSHLGNDNFIVGSIGASNATKS